MIKVGKQLGQEEPSQGCCRTDLEERMGKETEWKRGNHKLYCRANKLSIKTASQGLPPWAGLARALVLTFTGDSHCLGYPGHMAVAHKLSAHCTPCSLKAVFLERDQGKQREWHLALGIKASE